MQDIRLIELFAGYGSQAMALKRAGVPFSHYRVVEFDKYAIKSYNAVHGTDFIPMDITKVQAQDLGIVDTDKYTYLMTYSFPCTDLSVAGKMEGMSKNSGTRSGLLWEVERILNECKELPQFLLMENVTQVHGKNNINDFNNWISFLHSKGYHNKWADLNSKDFGIPQNRDRCFMISYLDKSIRFEFPKPIKLSRTVKDFLEDKVEDKYYMNPKTVSLLVEKLVINDNSKGIIKMERSDEGKSLRRYYEKHKIKHKFSAFKVPVVRKDGLSNTLTTVQKDNLVFENSEDTIKIKANNSKKYYELVNGGAVDLSYPNSNSKRGRVKNKGLITSTITTCQELNIMEKMRGYLNYKRIDKVNVDIAKTLCARDCKGFNTGFDTQNGVIEKTSEYRIRRLTPLECFRLMGVSNEDALKMISVNSNTQLYKQAGNSIVVDVMVEIFKNLFLGGSDNIPSQMDIYDFL